MKNFFWCVLIVLASSNLSSAASSDLPYVVPVVVVKYFPVQGEKIDIAATGDWGKGLEFTRAKVDSITKNLIVFLEESSRYHVYKDPKAASSLRYKIVGTYEFLEPLPTLPKVGNEPPLVDYNRVVSRIDGEKLVEEKGVKEIWLWGYHGGKVGLWESNMAGPFGDVSNSDRNPHDLPGFGNTYTLYHYNYQRGLSETVEDHMHQIEALLNHVDGRDTTDEDKWSTLLFWGKFVGSDKSHKVVHAGCGWAHYPPNGEKDYDWANKKFVDTDIEDWKPDGTGVKQNMNCEKWNCNSLSWFQYWMQNLAGYNSGLSYHGKPLTNWWIFVGAFDKAMKNNMKLTAP